MSRPNASKRPLAVLATFVLATAVAGCSTGSDTSGDPEAGDVPRACEECVRASSSWKTVVATWCLHSPARNFDFTLAAEKDGMIALIGVMHSLNIVIKGSVWYFTNVDEKGCRSTYRFDYLQVVRVFFAVRFSEDSEQAQLREYLKSSVRPNLKILLSTDNEGRPVPTIHLVVNADETPFFDWVRELRADNDRKVTMNDRALTVECPAGRFDIDRRTGLLLAWSSSRESRESAGAYLTRFTLDAPVNPALFDVSGEPFPPELERKIGKMFVWAAFNDALAETSAPRERFRKGLAGLSVYYAETFPQEERERLSGVGRQRAGEAVAAIRKSRPAASEEEIREISSRAASAAIHQELKPELDADFALLLTCSGLAEAAVTEADRERFQSVVNEALERLLVENALRPGTAK